MQTLSNAHRLARFMLVWFALSIGAAVASPLVNPQTMELICSGAGVTKVLVKTDEGSKDTAHHTLDCPLCLLASAPPPVACLEVACLPAASSAARGMSVAHFAEMTGAPLPARGPPDHS